MDLVDGCTMVSRQIDASMPSLSFASLTWPIIIIVNDATNNLD